MKLVEQKYYIRYRREERRKVLRELSGIEIIGYKNKEDLETLFYENLVEQK